jgi:hypothetical protein
MADWACGHERRNKFIPNLSSKPIGKADLEDQTANGRTNRKMVLSEQHCEVRSWTEMVHNGLHIQYFIYGSLNDSFSSSDSVEHSND